jgi:predicted lipase
MKLRDKFEITQTRPFRCVGKETDTQWDWERKGDKLILRVEETKSKKDWFFNFWFLKKPYKDMDHPYRVHIGFLLKWKNIQEDVMKLITPDVNQVEVYGFSQGAAIATLIHEDIWYNFPRLRENGLNSWVFGCPRVVSWNAPTIRWKTLTRVSNSNDMVTKVPFFWMGFKHVQGEKIHVGKRSLPFFLVPLDHEPNKYRTSLTI